TAHKQCCVTLSRRQKCASSFLRFASTLLTGANANHPLDLQQSWQPDHSQQEGSCCFCVATSSIRRSSMLRRFPAFKTLLLSSSIAALTACGGGAGSSTSTGGSPQSAQSGEPVVMQGQFLDSAVEGLWYETATQSGFTDWYGGFS